MNLVDELHAVAGALREAGITHAICGGLAVTIHGATRTTKDIDVLLSREDLARALDAVRPLGFAFAALPMTFDEGTERERHVQRVTKLEGQHALVLDLRLAEAALSGFLADRIELALPQGTLMVVSRESLLAMKRLAGRAQDVADLEKLEQAMKADLSPAAVATRLERLRVEVVLESVAEARRRLAANRVAEPSLARAAEQRLAELRSLCDLTEYLQSRGKPSGAERP